MSASGARSIDVTRVGLVGCGRMGTSIGKHLVAGGWPLAVTDVDASSVERLAVLGATAAQTPADVARSSAVILVVVVDDAQVRDVVGGSDGVMAGAADGSIVAVCSSVSPKTCRELADLAAPSGVTVIDAALARGERGAEAGELLVLCGGPAEAIDACRPAFGAFATDVVRVGDVGTGQVAKAVNNILLWSCLRADVEALRLGRALGVEPSVLRTAVELGSGANRPLQEWGRHRLRWPAKDLAVALRLAEEAAVDVPLVRALAPLMDGLTVEDLHDLL